MNQELLSNFRVLEIQDAEEGDLVPVAYCGMLLRLLGAQVDVVRSGERRRRDPEFDEQTMRSRTGLLEVLGAGKRTILLPPRSADHEILRIAEDGGHQVVILGGNGGPGVERIRKLADRLSQPGRTVVAITPFGLTGPKSSWHGSNLIALAAGGSAYYTPGWCHEAESERPLQIGPHAADYLAGVVGAAASLGPTVFAIGSPASLCDVSVQDTVLSMAPLNAAWVTHEGLVPSRMANTGRGVPLVPFRCADGLFSLLTPQESQWQAWVDVMGNPEWAQSAAFATREDRNQNWDVLKRLIEEWSSRYTKEWLWRRGQAAGVPTFPVNTIAEAADAEQFRYRGLFQPVSVENGKRKIEVPFGVFNHISTAPAPSTIKASADEAANRPVRVVDFSWVLAGPRCTTWLGYLGADVLRIESSAKLDQFRVSPPFWQGERDPDRAGSFNHINQNKRSITIDLRQEAGRQIVLRLIEDADLVIENFGPGQMERFGLDEAAIRAANPNVVIISSSGLGRSGPDANVRAYGNTIHAYAGLTSRIGYAPNDVRGLSGTWADPLTGAFLTLVAQAALIHRARTGEGVSVDLSMAEVTALGVILDSFVDYGLGCLGESLPENRSHDYLLNDTFRCQGEDSWVALSVRDRAGLAKVAAVFDDPQLTNFESITDLTTRIADSMGKYSADEIVAALQKAGVAAHLVANAADALGDAHPSERTTVVPIRDPHGNNFPVVGLPWLEVRNGKSVEWPRRPAPLLGVDTATVLREELGLSEDEIAKLEQQGVLR